MALQNGGGIRAAIPAGNITVGQVITVLPFGNTLALMDVTGAELKAAFEVSLKNAPKKTVASYTSVEQNYNMTLQRSRLTCCFYRIFR